eukprot:Rmarinus@m.10822
MEKRELLSKLDKERIALEEEAEAIVSELEAPGGAGVKGPLTDPEGFPRSDVDVYRVRQLRNRLACLQTDHQLVMSKVESAMREVFPRESSCVDDGMSGKEPDENLDRYVSKPPLAFIDWLATDGPAATCGLKQGDCVLKFGLIERMLSLPLKTQLQDVAKQVQSAYQQNASVPLIILREGRVCRISLLPKRWGGNGLLGCHLQPLENNTPPNF